MNRIHDNIKILYNAEGYLPNWPYHLISDDEMMEAFLKFDDSESSLVVSKNCFFHDKYPLLSSEQSAIDAYQNLLQALKYFKQVFLASVEEYGEGCLLPNWVYSYMLGSVISVDSDYRDIHDLLVALGVDNIDDQFSKCAENNCLKVSDAWISKHVYRPNLGHIIYLSGNFDYMSTILEVTPSESTAALKSLLKLNGFIVSEVANSTVDIILLGSQPSMPQVKKLRSDVTTLTGPNLLSQLAKFELDDKVYSTRPATIFGEPHVLKSLRLSENPLV